MTNKFDHLISPSTLCTHYENNAFYGVCGDRVRIVSRWVDGEECWSVARMVKRRGVAGRTVRKWRYVDSGSSTHCATAWADACMAARSAARWTKYELRFYDAWVKRNQLSKYFDKACRTQNAA